MKQLLFITFMMLLSLSASADVVKGRVIDSETKDPIEGADVQFIAQHDSYGVQTWTVTTDSLGSFCSKSYRQNTEVKINFIGYYEKVMKVSCWVTDDTLDIGDIQLKPNEVLLQEVSVTGHAKRFTMRGDTVVFHPEAFKLEEGDRLQKLIEKLPGVTTKDGKLYWNERPITLQMNGQDALSGDLLGKLPAEAVKEIKGYDKKSDYTERTGLNDQEDKQVLDIVIKPGFLEKWYGQAKGSAYTKKNYEASLNAQYLSDNNPLMAYFRVGDNNTSYEPIDYSNAGVNGTTGRYRQQIGALGYQHNWKPKYDGWKNNSYWNIESHANHIDECCDKTVSMERFASDGYSTFTTQNQHTYDHAFKVPLHFWIQDYIGSSIKLYAYVNADYNKGRTTVNKEGSTNIGDEEYTAVNKSKVSSTKATDEGTVTGFASLTKYVKKDEYSINARIDYTNGKNNYGQTASYDYLQSGTHESDMQSYNNRHHNVSGNVTATAKNVLSKNFILGTRYRFNFSDDYEKFDRQRNGAYDFANSSEMTDLDYNHDFTLMGMYNLSKFSLLSAIHAVLHDQRTDYQRARLDTIATRTAVLPMAEVMMQWKINKQNSLRFSGSYKSNLPDIINTLNYLDDTNPLYVTEGNPNLKRWGLLDASMNYVLAIPKHEQMLSVAINYKHEYNPLQDVTYYNTHTGVYRTHKENIQGGNIFSAGVGYDRGLGDYWEWKNKAFFLYADSHGVLTILDGSSKRTLTQQSSNIFSYAPSFIYQRGNWKLNLNAESKITHNSFEEDEVSAYTLYRYKVAGNVQYTFLKHFTVYLDGELTGRKGYHTDRFNRDDFVMNAAIWYKLLKNKLTLRIDANDIFNKQIFLNTEETSTSRTETSFDNSLHHYAMFTIQYDFDAKGGKKK